MIEDDIKLKKFAGCQRAFVPAVSTSKRTGLVHVRVSSSPGAGSAGGPSDIPAVDRRQLLCTTAGLAAASALLPLLVADNAAAAASCDLAGSPSGLQYCDTKVGDGPEPAKGALIRCHYTGRLASNGRVFDSSYERGRPLTFKIGVHEVISGWDLGILGTEGVPPMKEGGKRELLIPSELAYGARGAGGVIPPNADLLFTVELLGKPGRR